MGFIDYCCPSAAHMMPEKLTNGADLPCNSNNPTVAFIFKTVSEPHLGDMSYFKVCSGKVTTGMDLINTNTDAAERISNIYTVEGKKRDNINEVMAGDIAATVKLKRRIPIILWLQKVRMLLLLQLNFLCQKWKLQLKYIIKVMKKNGYSTTSYS